MNNNYIDHEFKTLIRAVLNNRIYEVKQIAGYQYSQNAAYAQSFLATLQKKTYDRISAKVVENQGHSKRDVGEKFDKNIYTSKVLLFPNPTQNTLHIVLSDLVELPRVLYVYNIVGEMVVQTRISSNHSTLDTTQLPNGLYYCKIEGIEKTELLMISK